MARRLGLFLLGITLSLASGSLPCLQRSAFAQEAEMDEKGEAEAKQALRLYKQGLYEEAAKLFAKLSVDYPDMLIFERNLGACFYYLRKPEPALSNLRHYLSRKQDIEPDDKVVVERWIGEMEKLREQNPATTAPPVPPIPMQPVTAAPTAAEVATKPAAIDLTSTPAPSVAANQGRPFYTKWWFWGTVGVAVAGSVTALLLASHGGTQNACSGETLPCNAIK